MKDIHQVNISHQTVLNYNNAVSVITKPFVDYYPYCGFNLTIWLRSEASIVRSKPKVDALYNTYKDALGL